ncbi:MAG TPA: hypothetical protein VGD37_06250 [Kofleriaceae bacterium]
MHRLTLCLVIALSSLAAPRPAAAAATDVYDTVDSVEVNNSDFNFGSAPATVVVVGILAGGTTPSSRTYNFGNNNSVPGAVDTAMHCQRLAVVAMSKPGKFQFAIGPGPGVTAHGCKLILRAP